VNANPKYRRIYDALKKDILSGNYAVGDILPSENTLCAEYSVTRTTVRKALDELEGEGYVYRHHGKGSIVKDRRKSLGLLSVKGFSETVGSGASSRLVYQQELTWEMTSFGFEPTEKELHSKCILFCRQRFVEGAPVMVEVSAIAKEIVPGFDAGKFTDGSFFKTLSSNYLLEITGSEQIIRASMPEGSIASLLEVGEDTPILHVRVRYSTSKPGYYVYSTLYCNTSVYPLSSSHKVRS